jgi:hypothetical protein
VGANRDESGCSIRRVDDLRSEDHGRRYKNPGWGGGTAMSEVLPTGPNRPSIFAVMLTVSAETPVARPAVLIVAMQELDDFHVTWLVPSVVLEARPDLV